MAVREQRDQGRAGAALDALVRKVERQAGLDGLGETLQQAVAGAYQRSGAAGQRIKDILHGVWLGHPLHPAVTDVPVGAATVVFVLDLLEVLGRRKEVAPGADVALAVGLLGATVAAASGLTDWQHLTGEPRRVGLTHGLINTGAAALYSGSLLLRRRGLRGSGRALSSAGYAAVIVSAYLGGDLVFREHIGIDHATREEGPDEFTPVATEASVTEGQLRRVDAAGTPVLLVRSHGRVYALADRCAHLGCSLANGSLRDDSVMCRCHGSQFALDGGCVLAGPATFPQPVYEVRVREGRIEVRRQQAARRSGRAAA